MTKKKPKRDDLSVRIMRTIIDNDARGTITLLQGASDAELKKLVKGFIEFTRMVAVYATKRGIQIEGTSIDAIAVQGDPGKN